MPDPPALSERGGWPDREQGLSSVAAAARAPPRRARVHHANVPQEAPSGPRGLGALMNSSPRPFSPHRLSLMGPPMLCGESPRVPWFLLGFSTSPATRLNPLPNESTQGGKRGQTASLTLICLMS